MFIGEYKHTVDAKRRVSLPAKLRKALGRKAFVTRGLDGNCLFVYSKTEWQKIPERAMTEKNSANTNITKKQIRDINRFFYAGASEVEVDSTGRILIPEYLFEFAELKDKVILAGVENRIEIWDETRWQTFINAVDAKEISESYDISS